jgi:hypothetical protein
MLDLPAVGVGERPIVVHQPHLVRVEVVEAVDQVTTAAWQARI